jgi:metal-responsive CopG/Arc/MetJ family transcriptional regulator
MPRHPSGEPKWIQVPLKVPPWMFEALDDLARHRYDGNRAEAIRDSIRFRLQLEHHRSRHGAKEQPPGPS